MKWRAPRRRGLHRRTSADRKAYWKERSRTAAIAKHTNAFKLNEDVVIPLERLGEYSDEIERINIEFSFKNKIRIAGAFIERLADTALDERPGITFARDLAARVRTRWEEMRAAMDGDAAPYLAEGVEPREGETVFLAMRDGAFASPSSARSSRSSPRRCPPT